MSLNRGMHKEDVLHIYNGMNKYILSYKKKKNEIMPSAARWMDLETIILSEVSKRKTNTI